MDHPPAHGKRRDARRADHGIELAALRQKQVHQLGEQHAAHRVQHKGRQPQQQNEQRFGGHEFVGGHLAGYRQSQQDGDEVGQHVLRSFGQRVEHAAFPQQVAEHQKAHQRHAGGSHQPGQHRHHDGEQDAGGFAHAALPVGHADAPLLLGGYQPDDRRLHDGHQRHVAVRRHHDGPQIPAAQLVGHKDGGRAVRRADDGDGGGVRQRKKQPRQHQREENAQLGRRAEQHQPGLFQQRAKVDHRADADEQQKRKQLVGHDRLKQYRQGTFDPALRDGPGQRQIHQNRPEAHGQQQAGLHFFDDGKVDQHAADAPHHHHLPVQRPKGGEQAAKGLQKFHTIPPVCAAIKKDLYRSGIDCDKSLRRKHRPGQSCRGDGRCGAETRPLLPFILFLLYAKGGGMATLFCKMRPKYALG